MSSVTCPHCGATDVPAGAFCEKCGKALPSEEPSFPRVVSGPAVASTTIGRQLQSTQLRKRAGQAFSALLAVSILTTIGGIIIYAALSRHEETRRIATVLLAVNLGLAALYAILSVWARRNPLPPAIIGLVVYVTIQVINLAADPANIAQGWLVKIIIIVVLAKAIQAGVQYRQLLAEMRQRGDGGTDPPQT